MVWDRLLTGEAKFAFQILSTSILVTIEFLQMFFFYRFMQRAAKKEHERFDRLEVVITDLTKQGKYFYEQAREVQLQEGRFQIQILDLLSVLSQEIALSHQRNNDLGAAVIMESERRDHPEIVPVIGPDRDFLVMVVEDDPASRHVAKKNLELLGCKVVTACDGEEGVKLFKLQTFSMVFMDHVMPKMDGPEAIQEIRKIDAATGNITPIILMTAHRESDTGLCGADAFARKPIMMEQLADILKSWEDQSIIQKVKK